MSWYMDDEKGHGLIGRGMSWRLIFFVWLLVCVLCPITLTYMGFASFQGWSPRPDYQYDERYNFAIIPQGVFEHYFTKGK